MSSIERLGIQGIRSFSPDDEQVIVFYKPITLICGPNGTGKSTIIECLKYATTGILPPSIKSGQAFIFDPDLANVSEVKATIRLLFKNRTKKLTFVGRSFSLTQKKNKKQFAALDGTLKMKDSNNKEAVSQSHRCSDLDKLVPELLGVSSAILDNVLFCHQEDANWPVKDGAELKKKFDDIFESSRYTKALVELKKAKKETAEKHKDAQRDVAIFATNLEHSIQLKADLEDCKLELEQNAEKALLYTKEIDATKLELDAVVADVHKFDQTFQELRELTGVISERERLVDRERSELNVPLAIENRPLAEVQEAAVLAKTGLENTKNALTHTGTKRSDMDRKKQQLQTVVDKLNTDRASLNARLEEFGRQLKRHQSLVSEARVKYAKHFKSLPILSDQQQSVVVSTSAQQDAVKLLGLHEVRECMKQVLKDKREEMDQLEASTRMRYDDESKKINLVRGEISGMIHQRQTQDDLFKVLANKLDVIKVQLLSLGEDTGNFEARLRDAKQRAKRAEKALEDQRLAKQNQSNALKMQELNQKMKDVDLKKKRLEEGMVTLESQQSAWGRLENKREEVLAKLKAVDSTLADVATKFTQSDEVVIVKRVQQNLTSLLAKKRARLSTSSTFGEDESTRNTSNQTPLPTNSVKSIYDDVQRLNDLCTQNIKRIQDDSNKEKRKKEECLEASTMIQGKLDQLVAEIQRINLQKRDINEKLPKDGYHAVLDEFSSEFNSQERHGQTVIRLLQTQVKECTQKRLYHENVKVFFTSMIKKLEKNPEVCPTCEQSCAGVAPMMCNKPMDMTVSQKVLKFTPQVEYKESKALQLKLMYKTDASNYTERLNEYLAEEEAAQNKLRKFISFDDDAQRMHALEQEASAKTQMKQELEDAREVHSQNSSKFTKAMNDLELPLRNLNQLLETLRDILRFANEALRHDVEWERESKLISAAGSSLLGEEFAGLSLQQARNKARQLGEEKDLLHLQSQEEMSKLHKLQAEFDRASEEQRDSAQAVVLMEKESIKRRELVDERRKVTEEQNVAYNQSELFKSKMRPLEEEAEILERERSAMAIQLKAKVDALRKELEICQGDEQQLNSAKEQIELAVKNGTHQALVDTEERAKESKLSMEKVNQDLTSLDQEKRELDERYRAYSSQVALYQNALRLFKLKEELQAKVEQKQKLEMQVSKNHQGVSDLKVEVKRLEEILASRRMRKEKLLGSREAYEKRRREIQAQLMEPKLKDVERNHAEAMTNAVTSNMAAKDLDKYTKALDIALMRFHAEKVEDINKRIRDLWQVIYKGGDIDRIELKADKGTGVSAHTYTYRVVMRKNHTELDLKGRCSAGQKVLASLVIRLALADTFSLNCGVLALDEPSANLDLENKRGLAEALGDLIKSRKMQENFQLILITHDEEFVEIMQGNLGNTGAPYYRLSREQDATGKYVSKIKEVTGDGAE